MGKNDNATPFKAADYDANVFKTVPFYEQFFSETICMVKTVCPEPAVWLDTGCGTGGLIHRALPHFPRTRFYLTDPSAQMLEQARERFAGSGDAINILPPMPSQRLHGAHLPPPSVITAIQCHHYLDNTERKEASEACFRILSAGGLYVTFENFRPASDEGVKVSLGMWKEFQLSQGRDKQIVEQHAGRFDKEYFPITVEEHLGLLRECGYAIAELFWLSRMQAGFYAVKSR